MAWAPDYITLEDIREILAIEDDPDVADDGVIERAIAAASRAIDRHCCRQFGKVDEPQARVYTARWSRSRGAWLVPIDDMMTLDGFAAAADRDGDGVYETELDPVIARPRNAVERGYAWTELLIPALAVGQPTGAEGDVQVTALFGWTAVPTAVEQACQLQTTRLVIRKDAPFGVAGSPNSGSEMRLLARVDPDVAVTLRAYRRRVRVG